LIDKVHVFNSTLVVQIQQAHTISMKKDGTQ